MKTKSAFNAYFRNFGMTDCKEAATLTLTTVTPTTDSEEPLDADQHLQYRRVVGKLQWKLQFDLIVSYH